MVSLAGGARVTLFLPVNDRFERLAAAAIVSEVNRRYGGSTHSPFEPPTFRGYWVDVNGDIIIDEVAVLIVDVQRAVEDHDFTSDLEDLRESALTAYSNAGSLQTEVWLVLQPIYRVVES